MFAFIENVVDELSAKNTRNKFRNKFRNNTIEELSNITKSLNNKQLKSILESFHSIDNNKEGSTVERNPRDGFSNFR